MESSFDEKLQAEQDYRRRMVPFGARVRMARAFADINQPDLATALEISEGTLRKIESGKNTLSKPEITGYAQHVANLTGVPVEFLLADDPFAAGARTDRMDEINERLQRIEDALGSDLADMRRALTDFTDSVDPEGRAEADESNSPREADERDTRAGGAGPPHA